MRFSLTLVFLATFYFQSFAQVLTTERYQSTIYGSQLISDEFYATAPQWIWPYWNEDLYLDVYQPVGDLNTNRPMIIFAHAGGFLNGSKDVDNMHAICDTFARKGFVTATIDYRKGFDPLDTESAERAVYRSVQDGKAAVRYFKENASTYQIDTNEIFFAGMSAGGFIAYHVAYLDQESERPASTYGGGTVNDLGCLDCAGNTFAHSSEVKAVLNFWGATIDTTFMQSGDVPIYLMHGKQDPTVPYGEGYPFGLSTLPLTYGSGPIKNQADAVGVQYDYYFNNMDIHMMDGSNNGTWDPTPNSFWGDTLLPFSTTFIHELIKPTTIANSPISVSLFVGDAETFEVSNAGSSAYEWFYDQANIDLLTSADSDVEEFEFNVPGNYQIKVVEYNHLLAAGDTITFDVEVIDNASIEEPLLVHNVYPNPTTGILFLDLFSPEPVDVAVFNLAGQQMALFQMVENSIDLSDLPSGVYTLQIRNSEAYQYHKVSLIH